MSAILARFGRVKRRIRAMATKGIGGVKAVKAAPTAALLLNLGLMPNL
jgi:hypothetical protein